MDLFNIAELNRWVLLILMVAVLFWISKATTLKNKEIENAKARMEVLQLDKKLRHKQLKEQDIINDIRRKQLKEEN